MNQRLELQDAAVTATNADTVTTRHRSGFARRFPGTDMPVRMVLALLALGLPRSILADLDVVEPESGLLYYVLALTPFAVWLAVAVGRRSRRPAGDFLVLGVLYGLSLIVIHQALWDVGPSLGHHPPASALAFADQFGEDWRDLALRTYTSAIAMVIGAGVGLVAAFIAVAAARWRRLRTRMGGRA